MSRIGLTKDVQVLHTENCSIAERHQENLKGWSHGPWLRRVMVVHLRILPKSPYGFKAVPVKNPSKFLCSS